MYTSEEIKREIVDFFRQKSEGSAIWFQASMVVGGIKNSEGGLSFLSAPLSSWSEEELKKAFFVLKAKGLPASVSVWYNRSDLRMASKRFPAMTASELEETLYWEGDRLFSASFDLAITWDVIFHDDVDCVVSASAVPIETIHVIKKAAKDAGILLNQVVPVTAVMEKTKKPSFYLFVKKTSASLVFRHEKGEVTRLLKQGEAGDRAATFLARQEEIYGPLPRDMTLLPMDSCDGTSYAYWKRFIFTWKEQGVEGLRSFLEDNPDGTTEEKIEPGIMERWWNKLSSGKMDFLKQGGKREEEGVLLPGKVSLWRWGAVTFCFIAMLYGVYGGYVYSLKEEAKETLAACDTISQAKKEAEEEKVAEKERIEEWKAMEKENPRWERKWVTLSEAAVSGIVLRKIQADTDRVTIEGSADTKQTAEAFAKNLERYWDMNTILSVKQRNPGLSLVAFSVTCTAKKEGRE